MTKKAIITVGISASGKTTFAQQYRKEQASKGNIVSIICRDDIRRDILAERLGRALEPGELWTKWKFKDENLVTVRAQEQVSHACKYGHSIVIADTNLIKKYLDGHVKTLTDLGFEVEIKEFPITFEDAVKRDLRRQDSVGADVIWRQFKQWNTYIGRKTYVADESKPKAIMVDIDGTLAKMSDRGPFEWSRVGEDEVDAVVKFIVNSFHSSGVNVIVMSGRDSICKSQTEKWLKNNDIRYHEIHMRAENDSRKDSIVKEELFWGNVADKYDVVAVIDDRLQVCEMWEAIGLKLLKVGNLHYRF